MPCASQMQVKCITAVPCHQMCWQQVSRCYQAASVHYYESKLSCSARSMQSVIETMKVLRKILVYGGWGYMWVALAYIQVFHRMSEVSVTAQYASQGDLIQTYISVYLDSFQAVDCLPTLRPLGTTTPDFCVGCMYSFQVSVTALYILHFSCFHHFLLSNEHRGSFAPGVSILK